MSCCGNPEFLGRRKRVVSVSNNQDVDVSLALSIKAELLTDTPCVIDGSSLESTGDTFCEESSWHYLKDTTMNVTFNNGGSSSNNLRITITELVPNPHFYQQILEEKK